MNHNEVQTSPGTIHQGPSSATEDVLHLWIQNTSIHMRYLSVWGVQAQVHQRTLITPHHTGKVGWLVG